MTKYRVAIKKIVDLSIYVDANTPEDAKNLALSKLVTEDESFFVDEATYTVPQPYVLLED